jgi:hypothetical protein
MIRTLLALSLLAVCCVPAVAQEVVPARCPPPCIREFPAPHEDFCGPELPCFTKQMTPNEYKWFVIEQNKIAYDVAAVSRRDSAGTMVHESSVYGYSAGTRYGGFNNYSTRDYSRIAPGAAGYGGGPVWIHNPYCPPCGR